MPSSKYPQSRAHWKTLLTRRLFKAGTQMPPDADQLNLISQCRAARETGHEPDPVGHLALQQHPEKRTCQERGEPSTIESL